MKTAVEWLAETLTYNTDRGKYVKDIIYNVSDIIEQAKQMEKEQIIEARNNGIEYTINGYSMRSEKYYNETYKNTNQ